MGDDTTAGSSGDTTTDGGTTTTGGGSGSATGIVDDGCICASIYDPVCGKDGKTYGNACSAACAGVEVKREGECLGDCSGGNCLVAAQTPGLGMLLVMALALVLRGRARRRSGS